MTARRRVLLPCTLLVVALALAGCSGTTARTSFSFEADGSFTQEVSLSELQLPDDAVASVEEAGWQVEQGDSLTASREFESAETYDAPAATLYSALTRAFADSAGWAPRLSDGVTVRHVVTDYFLVQRHDVEVTVPSLDFAPEDCPTCDGVGTADCPDCNDGPTICEDCGGAGIVEGWAGHQECWDCDGTGSVECWTCDGAGEVLCYDCEGSGETPEWIQASYAEAVDDSRLKVEIGMPGILAQGPDDVGSWSLRGDEIEDADSFSARSYVVNWLYVGVAAAVLLSVLVIILALVVRSFRRRRARSAASVQPAPAPMTAAAPVPTAPVAQPAAPDVCRACGAPIGPDARFCRACGAPTGKDVS